MKHYEITFLVHPDRDNETDSILSKLSSVVTDSGGIVHRSENIGSRKLSYPIQNQFKASYVLMNVECNQEVIREIKNSFKFNDSIIRDLVLARKKAYTELSTLYTQTEAEKEIDPFPESENYEAPKKQADFIRKKDEEKDLKQEEKENTSSGVKDTDIEKKNFGDKED